MTGMDCVLVLAGLAGLFLGGEFLVRGAVGVAHRLTIPPLLIGLTVVGFGTSTPELLVSVDAALRGLPDIAIGNVVGSNIGNILLIAGLSALVWPIRVPGDTLRRDIVVMMVAALALIPAFLSGEMGRPWGAVLIAGLAAYLVRAWPRPDTRTAGATAVSAPPFRVSALRVLFGLVALLIGARFLVDGAVGIARGVGVSEAFIGLTVVAVGTSLPELATSLIAAVRRQSEIAVGTIVGSNIFNVLGILGATALIAPIPVAARFAHFDLPVMIAASALLTGLLLWRAVIGRATGVVLLLAYAVYVRAAMG